MFQAGNLFNLRRLQDKTKVQTGELDELLYADDMDKVRIEGSRIDVIKFKVYNVSSGAKKMLRSMEQVSQLCDNNDPHKTIQ